MDPEDLRRISEVRALVANGKAREQRENRRLTLREIADAIGTSPSTVYRWEQGTSSPRGAAALRLAEVLEITAGAA
ncbi:helix-turn-helix transcriptional regulator [Streptomyces sp. 378]|uniref:helix-turn-helix domain-containing protein n=1 Tax=Streptomyces sp. 378 TaxID=3049412 RepID=UPI0024C42913|nr:helix-turn-helix transcriptional regulator [Streptomyces sp. 378]MDK1344167.1 helix-turn-helix transcriptional regulator [Streptomyces sp. 378]